MHGYFEVRVIMNNESAVRREIIDNELREVGYIIQDMDELNLDAGIGILVREYPTSTGPVDYMIFINGEPCGVIEAKKLDKGIELITKTEKQTNKYKNSILKNFENRDVNLRFIYETTGKITRFTDYNDYYYRSREIFIFHTPDELADMLRKKITLRDNLIEGFSQLREEGFWKCQVKAIKNLEISFSQNKPKALIQMATGSGKTFTAITSIYRLLKDCEAKRVLFLVDTKNLGQQAMNAFAEYKPYDSAKTFTELYNVSLLKKSFIPESSNVVICTIQRLYSILKGEELDESMEEEVEETDIISDVKFNKKYPIGFFDFIFIDECHRSIYNVWKQVLDYFDAFQIGLTATPDKRTFGYFNENIVSEYTREQAIIDGVNVGEDEYIIKTEISENGATITSTNRVIEKRDRLTREKRWSQLDEDIVYKGNELDDKIINLSQIRNIIKAFKEAIETKVYPERKELPKTLIFAKNDSHADDIIQIVREEFGKGNEFCQKITYKGEKGIENYKPDDAIKSFRNDYNFRVAVTVNLIATGTDIKPLECLLFMRDVRSKNFYEQMKGRGTRTIDLEDLKKVSPSAKTNKDHFVIFDAVGVTKSIKSENRTLDRNPSMSLKELLDKVAVKNTDEDILTTLAGRLTRLDKIMTDDEKEEFSNITNGTKINEIVENLLNPFDEDYVNDKIKLLNDKDIENQSEDIISVKNSLLQIAIKPFSNPKLREFILKVKQNHEQIIDNVNIDTVVFSDWSENYEKNVLEYISNFRKFIEDNKTEIEVLDIIYNQKYKNKLITRKIIEELYEIMSKPPHNFTKEKLWNAYYVRENGKINKPMEYKLMDIISIIKYELGQIDRLVPFDMITKQKFKEWMFKRNSTQGYRFTEEQTLWLQLIRDHIITNAYIEEEDLDYSPFDAMGGRGQFYNLFKDNYKNIINDINVALAA